MGTTLNDCATTTKGFAVNELPSSFPPPALGVPEEPGSSFHCTQCPMQFLQRKQLAHHLSFKHPDMASRRFKCSICPRAFISKTKLQLHTLTHMGLKPYKCSHCGKPFSDPSNLRIHTRIHTGQSGSGLVS